MPTRSVPDGHVTDAPQLQNGWHKPLFALFLLSRATRIPAALGDQGLGGGPSTGWTVLWVVLALALAAYALSEWEILRASSWRMRTPQWVCLVLFHIGFAGYVVQIVLL